MMTWWAIVVLGALPGGFLIFLFQRLAIKKDFRSWTILAGNDGEFNIPAFRKFWWWILISIGIQFAGLFIGIVLLK